MENFKRNATVADIEASSTIFSCKRNKVDRLVAFELENPNCSSRSPGMEISAVTSSGGSISVGFCSDCSSNESCEIVQDSLKYIDLEVSSFETEISTCINKSSPSSEILEETEGMDSPQNNRRENARNHSRKCPAAARMPSEVELDEFFSRAEQYEQDRFAEKYNYDIVKDVPLEGRYQWVRLNQGNEKESC